MYNDIKALIARGKLDDAIFQLRENLQEDNEWENELINYSFRFSEIKKLENLDTLSFEEAHKKKNNIVKSLLELVDLIKKNSEYNINTIVESENKEIEKIKITKEKEEFKTEEALTSFEEARRVLKSKEKHGASLIEYTYIYHSIEELNSTFKNGYSAYGDVLNFFGHKFYWQKKPNEVLKLYGGSSILDKWEGKYAQICSIDVPEVWNGSGMCQLTTPSKSEDEDLIIIFYLTDIDYLKNINDYNKEKEGYFVGAFYLEERYAVFFYTLSKKNFEDIR